MKIHEETINKHSATVKPFREQITEKMEEEKYSIVDGKVYQIIPELKDSKSWNSYWKLRSIEVGGKHDDQQIFNFAMFMYCKLNYA